jgi:hypothetical protein
MRTPSIIVKVPTETSVADTRRALRDAGAGIAVVTYMGRDVGVVTEAELESPLVGDDEEVGDVVVDELVHVAPTADYLERMRVYRAAAWDAIRRRSPERARRLAARGGGCQRVSR